MRVRRFARGQGHHRLNEIVDAVNEPLVGDGLIKVNGKRLTLNMPELKRRLFQEATSVQRAKATAAAAASTTIAAVLLTAAGDAGTAISVTSLDGSDWDDLFPQLDEDDVFAVVEIDGTWYGLGFAAVGACA